MDGLVGSRNHTGEVIAPRYLALLDGDAACWSSQGNKEEWLVLAST